MLSVASNDEQSFIEAIDAIDNGIAQYDTTEPRRYSTSTDLSSRVGFLNPSWNERVDSAGVDVSPVLSRCTTAHRPCRHASSRHRP